MLGQLVLQTTSWIRPEQRCATFQIWLSRGLERTGLYLLEADATVEAVGAARALDSIDSRLPLVAIVAISVGPEAEDAGITRPAVAAIARITTSAKLSAIAAPAASRYDWFGRRCDGSCTYVLDDDVCAVAGRPAVTAIPSISSTASLAAIAAGKTDTISTIAAVAALAAVLTSRPSPSIASVGQVLGHPVDLIRQDEQRASAGAWPAILAAEPVVAGISGSSILCGKITQADEPTARIGAIGSGISTRSCFGEFLGVRSVRSGEIYFGHLLLLVLP
jgi:hypothetical protein